MGGRVTARSISAPSRPVRVAQAKYGPPGWSSSYEAAGAAGEALLAEGGFIWPGNGMLR